MLVQRLLIKRLNLLMAWQVEHDGSCPSDPTQQLLQLYILLLDSAVAPVFQTVNLSFDDLSVNAAQQYLNQNVKGTASDREFSTEEDLDSIQLRRLASAMCKRSEYWLYYYIDPSIALIQYPSQHKLIMIITTTIALDNANTNEELNLHVGQPVPEQMPAVIPPGAAGIVWFQWGLLLKLIVTCLLFTYNHRRPMDYYRQANVIFVAFLCYLIQIGAIYYWFKMMCDLLLVLTLLSKQSIDSH